MASQVHDARRIFLTAVEKHAPEQWPEFLGSACDGDAALRARVEVLLKAHGQYNQLLDGEGIIATIDRPLSERPGTVIGPYKLLEQIGAGGFGVVFMAEQTHPVQRKVALKVIKPGMDSSQVIARFEAERQALAMMDHVNIARVFDAGTTENGRPYFVMELVHGEPITKYCDDNRLTPRQRLELFVPVCQAIQHAHQKGIIHRDIKPSNVMVTLYDGKPVPKVIDFGVAKATEQKLTERTLFTQYGTMVGTLEYMSPEQAEMSALGVDTRSDIYSLGVLLYQLLTGSTPLTRRRLKDAAYGEILRIIKEEEPPKPSARLSDSGEALESISAQRHTEPAKLTKLVRGELDWIVMKALEKDRNRRYETANGLAADLLRYLRDEPVQACLPSAGYRLRKFARRNKVALITAFLVTLALVVGTLVSSWQAVRAIKAEHLAQARLKETEEARKEAVANLQHVRQAVDRYFTLVSESKLLDEPGLQLLRKELLEAAVDYYEILAERHSDDPKIRLERAAAYLRLAQIYFQIARYKDMCSALEKGFDEVEKVARQHSEDPSLFLPLAGFWHGVRDLPGAQRDTGPTPAYALGIMRKGIALWEIFVDKHPEVPGFQEDLSKFYDLMEDQQTALGQRAEALHSMNKVREIREQLVRKYPEVPEYKAELSYAYSGLAVLLESENPEEAEKLHLQGITAHAEANVVAYRDGLARKHRTFARFLQQRKRWDEANEQCRHAIAIYEKLAAQYPHVIGYRTPLSEARQALADVLKQAGRNQEADQVSSQAIEADPVLQDAQGYFQRAEIYERLRKYKEALADYKKAVELEPDNAFWQRKLALFYLWSPVVGNWQLARQHAQRALELQPKDAAARNILGDVYRLSGELDKALAEYRKALESNPSTGDAAAAYRNLAIAYLSQGNNDEALKHVELAINADPGYAWNYANRGDIRQKLKEYQHALADHNKALELAPSNSFLYKRRAAAYCHLDQYDKALADIAKAIELNPHDASAVTWLLPHLGEAPPTFRDQLVKLADRLIEELPDYGSAYAARGMLYAHFDKLEQALADFSKQIELGPKNAPLLNNAAWVLVRYPGLDVGEVENAVSWAQQAVELAAKDAGNWNTLGVAHYRAGKYQEAIAALEKSETLAPGKGSAFNAFFLAMAHWQLGNKTEARKSYDQAVQWMEKNNPQDDELRRFRAEAEELLNIVVERPMQKPESN